MQYVKYCTNDFVREMPESYYLQNGDVLLNTLGNGTLGRSGIFYNNSSNERVLTDGHLFVFRTQNKVLSKYLLLFLRTKYDEIVKSANGTTNQTFLSLGKTSQWLIPVPPENEIIKIISELDKYEPLLIEYDIFESHKAKLDGEIYDKLKKSILQYAIQGKLVPQDSNDEPAAVLLERIRAEKKAQLGKKYVESYIYKGDDNCYYEKVGKNKPVLLENLPFDIPDSWYWARLGDIVGNHGQKVPNKPFSYIDIGSISNKQQKLNDSENIIMPEKAPSRARKIVCYGDILFATVRPYLHNIAIVDKKFSNEPIASTGFAVLSCKNGMVNRYLFYYLLSPTFDLYANSNENAKGVAYPAINDEKLYNALIAIPPYKEQVRICEQVKSIFNTIKGAVAKS